MPLINGTRIKLTSMPDDPSPLPEGAVGTIKGSLDLMNSMGCIQYMVDWDPPHEKRTLMVVSPPDSFEVIG